MLRDMRRASGHLVLLVGLLFWSGCSSFDRDFEKATSALHPAETIAGAWEGRWQSDNGHGCGELLCILTPRADGEYEARFKATYWGILKASYTVTLRGAGHDGKTLLLAGEEDLGWLAGGKYKYQGRVTPSDFTCSYESKYDHGMFTLTRPGARPPRTQAVDTAAHVHR